MNPGRDQFWSTAEGVRNRGLINVHIVDPGLHLSPNLFYVSRNPRSHIADAVCGLAGIVGCLI